METSKSQSLPTNPRDKANFFSVLIFWWTVDLFKKGYSKVLDVYDLYQPLKVDRSETLGDRLERKWNQQSKKPNPSLLKALLATFWREFLVLSTLSVISDVGLRLLQPILLGKLLTNFSLDGNNDQATNATYYALGLVLLAFVSSILLNHFTMNAFHIGMKFRIAICSVIYRKSLRLSVTSMGNTAPGKIVNLLSNDVSRFDIVSIFINSMWSAPLLAIVIGVILWYEIQWAGVVGIVVVFIVVPIQSYTGKLSSKFRFATALRTDERVRFMDEIISGVQVIKMYAWEYAFSKLIRLARKLEIKVIRKNSHVRALYMTFNLFTTRAAIFCTMMTMALLGNEITAAKVFVVSSYFNIIAWTMSQMFVRGVAEIAEALVAIKRLQAFLMFEEKDEKQNPKILNDFVSDDKMNGNVLKDPPTIHEMELSAPKDVAILLKNATAVWYRNPQVSQHTKSKSKYIQQDPNEDDRVPVLKNIDLSLKKGKLIGIVGHVGCGKSSLLEVILRELPLESGEIVVNGKLSFATQEPWVFAATVRQNILFGSDMEKSRYDAVVKSCALIKDFEQLPQADRTMIGEKGASLSGGQKARISLARAVYRKADIYLLDDPLSAVDAHVGRHLFDEVIGPHGRLARQNATRILVTHQVHFLKQADWIVVLKDGCVEIQGTPHDLITHGIDFADNFEDDENVDNQSVSEKRVRTISRSMSRSISKSSTRSLSPSMHSLASTTSNDDYDETKDNAGDDQNLEASSKDTVKGSIILNYFKSSGSMVIVSTVLLLFIITQTAVCVTDYWVSFWTSQEELRTYYEKLENSTTSPNGLIQGNRTTEILPTVLNETENINNNGTHNEYINILDTSTCMYIHGGIVLSIFTIGIMRSVSFYGIAMKASQNLHDRMFNGIISAPMRFFNLNPSGRILNRFSKDMGSVDELLPKALLDATQIILNMVGSIIVVVSVRPVLLVAVLVLFGIFWFIRKIYLKTSKNIKRLEGITRSPVFTHLSASLYGLSTIRAFGNQKELIREFDNHQNLHTGSWYIFISTSTAFGLSLDMICVVFLCCITLYFVLFESDAMGNQVGLAITQATALTGLLQWGIRQSAEVANQMMSVERILEYCYLEPEKEPKKTIEVSKLWPFEGKVEFRKVFFRYYEEAEPVLKGITFTILPKEKIGIVGRTGAGKSSLIGSIFRLALVDGEIIIDGIDTSQIPLKTLRSKISIIPQDPVLFSGTLRRNLDPFEEYPDVEIWNSLEAVQLKDAASGPLGLQTAVSNGGSNFSVGQRQLVCLARAILRKNRILVLDEATANVDPHTDSLIQTTIRQQFIDCTVLTIAHRLHTIMDSDRVIVMNFGKIEEFDTPYQLLQNPLGIFKDMVKATGVQESGRLYQIAKDKFESSNKTL